MTTYGNNPGWVTIWVLEVQYVTAPQWQGIYPSLPEAHAALRVFETNHRTGIKHLQISEGRLKVAPFLTQDL